MNLGIEFSVARAEIVLLVSSLALIMIDLVAKKKDLVALSGIVFSAIVGYTLIEPAYGSIFMGMFISDGYGVFFKFIFLINLILTILISLKYLDREGIHFGEYYCLLFFSTLGMMVMASAGDLISLYLGLELMALSTYVLSGFMRHSIRSNEAALKYFLLGAFASAFLLLAISLTYGITGTTEMKRVSEWLSSKGLFSSPVLLIALVFYVSAFSFKIAAVPFHMWAPDVYEGAPTSVTAFMSVGPKAAGFAVIGRVLLTVFSGAKTDWAQAVAVIAVATMVVGNVGALLQTNIKRMLAYSSVAHAGYALLGILAGGVDGIASVMNYLFIYTFMNIGAFAIVIAIRKEELSDWEGLSKNNPFLAALMLVFMFSLTGIPPTAGFVGKFYLFKAALNAGYMWLVVIAVLMSAVSAYFYLRVVMYMYMKEPKEVHLPMKSPALSTAMAITVAMVLLIGILPSGFLDIAKNASVGF